MPATNPLTVSAEEPFAVGKSDLAFFLNNPVRCKGGALLLCRRGSAEMTLDLRRSTIRPSTVVFVLPGTLLMLSDSSPDFEASYCAFTHAIFSEVCFRLEPAFFRFVGASPFSLIDRTGVRHFDFWFETMEYSYRDRENIFRMTIFKNRLQNTILEMYDKIQRKVTSLCPTTSDRQTELFHKFISLVHDHCAREREVAFYADRLCISPRYLSAIVRRITHHSAKELIDRTVVMDIKVLLQSTTLPIQEIADRMHFPDQSYLGRYFKKHTGVSPTLFRRESR
ncbi:MAG: helix-turn-helix domain-containing protein [Alistipes sp.]|nr:helix-turn-helix domain-containing protein [Alistipes sp.]